MSVTVLAWLEPRCVRSWRSTDNALESIAATRSDGLLVHDEIVHVRSAHHWRNALHAGQWQWQSTRQ
ncbi:hypothetical protein EMIT0357P_30517 [Pseudomonas marginalis]